MNKLQAKSNTRKDYCSYSNPAVVRLYESGVSEDVAYEFVLQFTCGTMNMSQSEYEGIVGSFNNQDFDFSADQWSGKLITKYKITKALDVEVTGRHESREQTIQGTLRANTFMDFGTRYKIIKGRGVFSMSIRDVFASRVRQNTIDQDDFYLFSRSQRGRFITFGFSYGFGKGEAMQYSGQRRR